MPPKVPITAPHRLTVEGPDDLHCIINLLRRQGLDYDNPQEEMPYIHPAGGFSALFDSIPVAAKSYKRLGIVIDADDDLAKRWQEIHDRLRKVGISLPDNPISGGAVVQGLAPGWRVGVWLMPDNLTLGTLETFLSRLIPTGDPCWDYAKTATKQAKLLGAKCPEKYFEKAYLHTWLSWQENPGLPFGTAITSAYFRADSINAQEFVTWFRKIFLE